MGKTRCIERHKLHPVSTIRQAIASRRTVPVPEWQSTTQRAGGVRGGLFLMSEVPLYLDPLRGVGLRSARVLGLVLAPLARVVGAADALQPSLRPRAQRRRAPRRRAARPIPLPRSDCRSDARRRARGRADLGALDAGIPVARAASGARPRHRTGAHRPGAKRALPSSRHHASQRPVKACGPTRQSRDRGVARPRWERRDVLRDRSCTPSAPSRKQSPLTAPCPSQRGRVPHSAGGWMYPERWSARGGEEGRCVRGGEARRARRRLREISPTLARLRQLRHHHERAGGRRALGRVCAVRGRA